MHINIRINIPIRNKSRHATAFILRNGFQGRSRSDNDNWAKSGKWGQVYLYRECLDSIERLSREGSIDSLDLRLNWGPKCDVPIRTFWTKTEFLFCRLSHLAFLEFREIFLYSYIKMYIVLRHCNGICCKICNIKFVPYR